jgi:hypothetical protein
MKIKDRYQYVLTSDEVRTIHMLCNDFNTTIPGMYYSEYEVKKIAELKKTVEELLQEDLEVEIS